ncbi:manganese catalase family protein [Haloprofundus salinisoli]|uniref:manganese catalase family protein n=1 Tax=Haloprofundus salinisoli TaxID=2876193 RepID=UPI001CCFBCEE|nr:manganese catalase family protein [Haloprofundus salinisoli]
MFYHEGDQLQYPVEVEEPDPIFAKMLQEGIGGVEGELRVALQYMAQAMGLPKTEEFKPYRRALIDTAAEEFGHVEMYVTAVHKNLQGAPVQLKEEVLGGRDYATLAGLQPRQFLSGGLNPQFVDANGAPFNGNYVVASGNLAADLQSNIAAESTGRQLACRLYEMTDDPGMKDMFSYLIARDTMHQNQWTQMLKDLGDPDDPYDVLPIPDSFPDEAENQEYNYAFMSTDIEEQSNPDEPWTTGTSPDDEGEFSFFNQQDLDGYEPDVEESKPETYNSPIPDGEDALVGDEDDSKDGK